MPISAIMPIIMATIAPGLSDSGLDLARPTPVIGGEHACSLELVRVQDTVCDERPVGSGTTEPLDSVVMGIDPVKK